MKLIAVFIILAVSSGYAQVDFETYFYNKSMRMDYFHIGDHDNDKFIFDELIEEPYFSGSHDYLVDDLFWGNHRFEIADTKTGKIIYSRGFSSLFQEWQSTVEAKKYERAFSESIIFPFPKDSVTVKIYNRSREGKFDLKFEHFVDPKDYFISQERKQQFPTEKIVYSGNPQEKLDIVFIPEGYDAKQMDDFRNDCNRFSEYLFKYEPFTSYKDEINIWAVIAPSQDSGEDIPKDSIWVNTVVSGSFYTFDSERYVMTTDMKSVHDLAANTPYDQIFIMVNSSKYGGGAIYNYYSMTVTKNALSEKVFVHEFAHGLAGLADEYGTDATYNDYYPKDVEPWEANITTLVDFESKWNDLVENGVPIPTPNEEKYKDKIGAFEGAGYVDKGVYRPTYDSMMRTFKSNEYNYVSRSALEKVIKTYLKN